MHRHTPAIIAALLVSAAPLTARAQEAAAPVAPWEFKFKKGDVQRYRTYIKVSARLADDSGNLAIATRSSSRHDIKDVADDGTTVYEQLDEKFDATFNGKPVVPDPGAPKPKPIVATVAKNGLMTKRVNPNSDPFDPADKVIRALQSMPVPTSPLKVGDTWKTDLPNPLLKNKLISANSTFKGTEKVLGVDALKIELKMDFPSAFGADESETVHYLATYYIDTKDHQLVRATYTLKNALLPFPAKNVQAQVYVSRIVPGQNDMNDPEGEKLIKGE